MNKIMIFLISLFMGVAAFADSSAPESALPSAQDVYVSFVKGSRMPGVDNTLVDQFLELRESWVSKGYKQSTWMDIEYTNEPTDAYNHDFVLKVRFFKESNGREPGQMFQVSLKGMATYTRPSVAFSYDFDRFTPEQREAALKRDFGGTDDVRLLGIIPISLEISHSIISSPQPGKSSWGG